MGEDAMGETSEWRWSGGAGGPGQGRGGWTRLRPGCDPPRPPGPQLTTVLRPLQNLDRVVVEDLQ